MGTVSELALLQSLEKFSPISPTPEDEFLSNLMEWDPVMKMPLPHLTFLLEALFPIHLFNESESDELREKLKLLVNKTLAELDVKAEIVIAGGPVDGLTFPQQPNSRSMNRARRHDDNHVDILLIVPDVSVGPNEQYQIRASGDRTNGFHLVASDSDSSNSHQVPLNAARFTEMQQARDKVDAAVGPMLQNRCSHKVNIALKYCSETDETTDEKTTTVASCHIVPMEDLSLWSYSLHEHFSVLSQFLSPVQKQAFAIINILMLGEFDYPAVITREHAKIILFNACKCVAVLSIIDLTKLLQSFFHQLLSSLVNWSLPSLSVPILSPSPSEDILQTVIDKLVDIRQSPMIYVLKHYPKVGVEGVISAEDLLKIIDPVFQDSKVKDLKMLSQHIANVVVPTGHKLISALVAGSFSADPNEQVGIMKRAFNLCEICNKMWNSVLTEKLTIKALHLHTAFKKVRPILASIRLYEHILNVYGSGGSELNDLACIYHSYIHTLPSENRKDVIQKTKRLFERAVSMEDQQGNMYDTYIDFCTFLCRMNLHEEAVTYLQMEIDKKENYHKFRHSYSLEEYDTVDEYLKQEIDYSPYKCVRVASGIYARYLMAQCHLKLGKQEDVKQLVIEMLYLAAQIENDEDKAVHFNMGGSIYLNAGLYDDAIQVFLQVLDIAPQNTVAEEFFMQCQALKLSLED